MLLETKDYKHFKIGVALVEGADKVDKALPGDEVDFDNKIVKLIKRKKHPQLVGIIELNSKYKYGFTSRGVPIYIFNPHNEAYPPMMVGCNERDTSINRICLVEFDKWDDDLPRGNLVKILGPAGDITTELEALYWRYSPWSMPSRRSKAIQTYDTKDTAPSREVIDWPYTFNVDPSGCRDIDDVISLKPIEDNTWLIAISIADVGEIVKPGTELDKHIQDIGQTLYQDGRAPRHMLPVSISEDIGSLILDKQRKAISLIFKLSDNNITEERFVETVVTNKLTFTYDTILNTTVVPFEILELLAMILRQKRGLAPSSDPHDWIEACMVYYNVCVAKKLLTVKSGLLRCHDAPSAEKVAKMEKIGLGFLGFQSAKYVSPTEDAKHWGLGLETYCHATSPLRRYSDIVNQWVIKAIIRNLDIEITTDINKLNKLQHDAKLHDRDVAFVRAISKNSRGRIIGIVLNEKHIYVEEWKTIVKYNCDAETGTHIELEYFCDMRQRSWKKRIVFKNSL